MRSQHHRGRGVLPGRDGGAGRYGSRFDGGVLGALRIRVRFLVAHVLSEGIRLRPVGSLFALLSVFGVLTLVLAALYFFANGLAEIWSMRAVGHWVARNAPDWVEEARDSRGVLS